MIDRHFRNPCANESRDCRNEAVHLAIEAKLLRQFGVDDLQRTSVIMQLDAGRIADDAIRDH